MKADTMNEKTIELPPLPQGIEFIAGANRHFAKVCGTCIAFTADQMNAHYIAGFEAGRSRAASEPGEVARLADDALNALILTNARDDHHYRKTMRTLRTLIDQLASAPLPASSPVAAEGQKAVADTFEHYVALREGSCNGVIDEYFRAREGWNLMPQGIFKDAFYRGFDARDSLSPESALYAAPQEAVERQPLTGWRPIETAPRDGKAIYVIVADAKVPEAGVAHWSDGTWRGGSAQDWEGASDPIGHFGIYPSPTHWQPLPEPPGIGPATQEKA